MSLDGLSAEEKDTDRALEIVSDRPKHKAPLGAVIHQDIA